MPVRALPEASFFSPFFADPRCLEPGGLPWLLAHHRCVVLPDWLFEGWHGQSGRGRDAWPATVLMAMVLLRWTEEGMSRRASVRQAQHHTGWRAAMGLAIGDATPSERTVRRFEKFLRQRHPQSGTARYLLIHEHWVRLCLGEGVVDAKQTVWAMDSTPMWAYGAVLDTVRLLGDGLRMLARDWARWTDISLQALSTQWQIPWLVSKSTKGGLQIDWRDKKQRVEVLDKLARTVIRVVRFVRRELGQVDPQQQKLLLRRCRHLLTVVGDDLQTDEAGHLVVAQRVAKDRMISMTDPQSRHGHKSQHRTFDGFKVHVLGDVVSGLIASVSVTAGNVHDGAPAGRLVTRAKNLCEQIERVLGDTAYGGAELRVTVRKTTGVNLLCPPPPLKLKEGRLGRQHIELDFEADKATCAQGIEATIRSSTWNKEQNVRVPVFRWLAQDCQPCPQRVACRGKQKGGHRIVLHPYEPELRDARAAWQDPQVRQDYRIRSQCERLIHRMTRHGARKARAWGLGAAQLQAHLIAMRGNLALLAARLAARDAIADAA